MASLPGGTKDRVIIIPCYVKVSLPRITCHAQHRDHKINRSRRLNFPSLHQKVNRASHDHRLLFYSDVLP